MALSEDVWIRLIDVYRWQLVKFSTILSDGALFDAQLWFLCLLEKKGLEDMFDEIIDMVETPVVSPQLIAKFIMNKGDIQKEDYEEAQSKWIEKLDNEGYFESEDWQKTLEYLEGEEDDEEDVDEFN